MDDLLKRKRKEVDRLYLHLSGYVTVYEQADGVRVILLDDMPESLAKAFVEAPDSSTRPAPGIAHLNEFERFLSGSDPMAQRYTGRMVIVQVDELKYSNLTVSVMKVVDPDRYHMYPGPFVRYEDLPEDLSKAFREWQTLAACPGQGMSYLHDFSDFMDCGGCGWSGDFSEVVRKYR